MAAVATSQNTQPGPVSEEHKLTRNSFVRGAPLLPALILLGIFVLVPVVYCIVYAFTDLRLTGAAHTHFIGLENFRRAFTDQAFYHSLVLTLIFTIISAIIGQNAFGLAIALLMRRAPKIVRSLAGAVVITAWVVPEIVAAYLLYAFFNDTGTLDRILVYLHLPQENWLFTLPILAVSLANIWRGTAFSMLIYSAALDEVPKDLTEAAEVDGANALQRFANVIMPVLRRTFMTNLMLITLQTLSVFGLIWGMTRGGPNNESQTLPIYTYDAAFQSYQIGYGTAVALILLLIGALFSVIYILGQREEVR